MSEDKEKDETDRSSLEGIYRDIAPYLENHEEVRDLLEKALSSENPDRYLVELAKEAKGTLRADLKIALNRMNRIRTDR